MSNFNTAYALTAKSEGGYSNNPNDWGGETWKGIARKKNPNWSGWATVDSLRKLSGFPGNLTANATLQTLVLAFYKIQFWDALKLDSATNQLISNKLFDIAVNVGQGFAIKALQKALNVSNQNEKLYKDVAVDGQMGVATLTAMNKHPRPDVLLKLLNVIQGQHYIDLAEKNTSQETFINGWFSQRIAGVIKEVPGNYA